MNEILNFLQDTLKRRIDSYRSTPQYILQEYILEDKIKHSYIGREVFELLQNADDASNTANNKRVQFKLTNDCLVVSNNGRPFSKEGFQSILFAGLSEKSGNDIAIGKKGYGFRSILNWSDDFEIVSGKVKVNFSKYNSKKFLDDLLNNNEQLKTEYKSICEECKRNDDSVAILVAPSFMENSEERDYETIISMKLSDNVFSRIEDEINQILPETLIFLNNITSIEIITPSYNKVLVKKTQDDNQIIISEILSGNTKEHRWTVLRNEFQYGGKPQNVSIAWNPDMSYKDNGRLFSYFVTQEALPLPVLAHGSFDLSSDRNFLSSGSTLNEFLIDKLTDTLIEAAIKEVSSRSYNALKLITLRSDNLGPGLVNLKFKDNLYKKVLSKELFPYVNGTLKSLEQKPFYCRDQKISDILKGDDVENLLCYCSDEIIYKSFIEKNVSSFSAQTFSNIINNRIRHINEIRISDYAYLLKYFQDCYNNFRGDYGSISPILIDDSLSPIPWENNIFIQDKKIIFEFPDTIQIRFVNSDLISELEIILEKDISAICASYKNLKMKVFSPETILEILVNHYRDIIVDSTVYAEMHRLLLLLFREYKGSIINCRVEHIKVLSKSGNYVDACNCYFGEEYNNPLISHLYSYDDNKILGSAKEHKIDFWNNSEAEEYFKWIGVNVYPKIYQAEFNNQNEYIDYLFERWNYKKNIGSISINTFEDYNKLNKERKYIVSTIDGLDDILKKADMEAVIVWVNNHKDLFNLLDNDNEPEGSYIVLSAPWNQNRMSSCKLFSYIRWKFMTTKWIRTRSSQNVQVQPEICSTSQTISDEFSPLIEKPDIKESNEWFIKAGIQRKKIEYILHILGVNSSISEFRTGVIYSVLNSLPSIDKEGKKARAIYRELVNNLNTTRIDCNNVEYIEYQNNGKVFCKNGTYQDYKNTFYLPTRKFGDSVAKQFNTITVDTRQNTRNVELIFGVKEFTEDKIHIDGEVKHLSISKPFEDDIAQFKPYVYLFRKDKDQNGTDKSLLKESSFELVSALNYTIEKENETHSLVLGDYEFYYDRSLRKFYISVPDIYSEYARLKEKVAFESAVAEAFAALFNVTTDSFPNLRELFSRPDRARQEIASEQFDDSNLSRLHAIESEFGITHNTKQSFWLSFLRCFPDNYLPKEELTDDELKDHLLNVHSELALEISSVIDVISNYSDYSSDIKAAKELFKLLKKANVSLEQFNCLADPCFDISTLFYAEYNAIRKKYKSIVIYSVYKRLAENPLQQDQFVEIRNQYDNYYPEVPSTLDYNVLEALKEYCQRIQVDLNPDNTEVEEDITEKYKSNKLKLVQELNGLYTEDYIDEYLALDKHDSMLYFDDGASGLIAELKQRQNQKEANGKNIITNAPATFASKSIHYSSIRDLHAQFKDIFSELSSNTAEGLNCTKAISINKDTPTSQGNNQQQRTHHSSSGNSDSGDIGAIGEMFVYESLCRQYSGSDIKVIWVSQYAKKALVNQEGKDGLGYDIVLEKDNTPIAYIEVKTCSGNSFHLSKNELDVGLSSKVDYDIYLVRNIESSPRIDILENFFKFKDGEDFMSNEKFSVVNNEFIVCFQTQ